MSATTTPVPTSAPGSAPTSAPAATPTAGPDGPAPTDRTVRIVTWVAVVVVGLLLAALTAAVGPGDRQRAVPLDPTSTATSGSRAVVRVLEQQGTRVDVVHDADALDVGTGDTVLVDDSAGVLDRAVARRIARTAPDVVLVTNDPGILESFAVDARPAGSTSSTRVASTATCPIPAARTAGSVTVVGATYDTDDTRVERCAPSGTGADTRWGLLRATTADGRVTVLGTTGVLRNDTVTRAGNAALALGLLGSGDRLVWYVPTADGTDAAPSLGDLAPPWVPSAIAVLGIVAVAAALWRGRRLGPLVVERLPVVVRAAETTEGRARLYARVRDRTHALDTLRLAAVRRIGRSLGLPRSAHVDEVVRRAAAVTGRSADAVGAVLVGGTTADDRALVDGAAALDELEHALRRARSGDVGRASRPDPTTAAPTRPALTRPAPTRPGPTRPDPNTTQPTTPKRPGGRS
ncbi:DUF4350 domain-containing protein [Curtobacterium herbarum]|uniref:DUF4350 domain-containing protein n=1 Tax=Curtobacterium herbarum TaxID=150122 RepID=A0ABN1ZH16_9MICO|nr:DUF4350 domain-containing protein [Curtobacterium herbarum]MBM7475028.1 hypothetical protein [Curtobacterium herbarum]MCS6545671.1 DUF4350 domain-containing protein [Curtobacterium herbarum]